MTDAGRVHVVPVRGSDRTRAFIGFGRGITGVAFS
jgi:hypothetical protein